MSRVFKKRRILLIVVLLALIFFISYRSKTFRFTERKAQDLQLKAEKAFELVPKTEVSSSPISGIKCANFNRRPLAVILASDPQARPLSGISQADLVIEMPVYFDITRMMAVYQCNEPEEIGALRSARDDFIPLAKSFDSIFVHWGGSNYALELLDKNVIDNIDALKYEAKYFYRKKRIKPPHNAFLSFEKIKEAIKDLNFREEISFKGYKFKEETNEISGKQTREIFIDYGEPYQVTWRYDSARNDYLRLRDGRKEIDELNNNEVRAKNLVIMKTTIKMLDLEYNDVNVIGEGEISLFQDGKEVEGSWYKKDINSKLFFFDKDGKEIEFNPGQIWIEIIDKEKNLVDVIY